MKAPRFGSWLAAAEVLDRCQGEGIDAWVGGMLDTGIGRRASVALAAHPGATVTGDLAASARFFARDVAQPVVVEGGPGRGTIAVPTGPGLGLGLDEAALEALTVRVEHLPA